MAKGMKRVMASAILMLACGVTQAQTAAKTLMLFDTPLKGATRDQLRQVFKAHGMTAKREDDRYWVDFYDPGTVLQGATKFDAAYVRATHAFAYVEYTFPSSMDTQQVARVIAMVQSKYGPPSSRTGDVSLGEVTVIWNYPGGMRIVVERGWPDTTTYLDYQDVAARKAAITEVDAEKKRQLQEQAAAQSNAF